MDLILAKKRVLLLVSGGIAIYKSLDLISNLKKEGAEVFVVMSEEATRFIAPLTFEAMSGNKVLCKSTESFPQISHITYANLADTAIIAPATINTIAKLNYGIADNLIVETLLACKCEVFIAPSANVNMLESPQNRANLDSLKNMGYTIIPPRVSRLACDIVANGAMAEVGEIIFNLKRAFYIESSGGKWRGKNIIITGGGSVESIDSIRHISNDSSGKQASNLALAFYYLGANVSLISSKFPIALPLGVAKIAVKSSADFKSAIEAKLNSIAESSVFISAAAISDFVPKQKAQGKLKKEQIGEVWDLQLRQNEDILSEISKKFGKKTFIVGFKAESEVDSASANAKKMLKNKNCDMVVLNIISKGNEIGGERNEVRIFTAQNELKIPQDSKLNISFAIAESIAQNLVQKLQNRRI